MFEKCICFDTEIIFPQRIVLKDINEDKTNFHSGMTHIIVNKQTRDVISAFTNMERVNLINYEYLKRLLRLTEDSDADWTG